MCNTTANINAGGVITAATWLLEAKESLTHVCVCVYVCLSRAADRHREREGEKREMQGG